MLVFFIPLLMIFLAPWLQITLSTLKLNGKIKLPLGVINLLALVLGLLLAPSAMMVSMSGLPPQIKCATGCVTFLVFGLLITIVSTPVIAIVSFLKYRKKEQV